MIETLEKILTHLIVIALSVFLTLKAVGDGNLKDSAYIPMSTVKWGEAEASVPEPIMREMNLKPGQEIDDDTAKTLTEKIVRYFKLEAKR